MADSKLPTVSLRCVFLAFLSSVSWDLHHPQAGPLVVARWLPLTLKPSSVEGKESLLGISEQVLAFILTCWVELANVLIPEPIFEISGWKMPFCWLWWMQSREGRLREWTPGSPKGNVLYRSQQLSNTSM